MGGIKMLHQEDPDLVNEPVDEYNGQALHYAVKHKNEKLLVYVLETGANINTQAGLKCNSALHEAVSLKDWESVKILFGHGINDELINIDGKRAIDLLQTKKCKREYTKAKQYKKNIKRMHFIDILIFKAKNHNFFLLEWISMKFLKRHYVVMQRKQIMLKTFIEEKKKKLLIEIWQLLSLARIQVLSVMRWHK